MLALLHPFAGSEPPSIPERLTPSRGPGKPLGDAAIRADLAKLGITTRAGRNTALLTLARDVPPSVLCDLLGVSTTTAERWREHAGGAWTAYAAQSLPDPRWP